MPMALGLREMTVPSAQRQDNAIARPDEHYQESSFKMAGDPQWQTVRRRVSHSRKHDRRSEFVHGLLFGRPCAQAAMVSDLLLHVPTSVAEITLQV